MGFPTSIGDVKNQLTESFDGVKSSVQRSIGSAANSTIKGQQGALPWTEQSSRFFQYIAIKPDRWDQLFPYRILVVDSAKGNQIVGGSPSAKVTVEGSNANSIISFEPIGRQWVFTLPISPQQLSITDQFAINVSATLRGVLEEHGGLKFKMISAGGTMGGWAYRQSVAAPPSSPNVLQSIFGGTIEAAQNLVGQAKRVVNAATSGHPADKPAPKRPQTSPEGYTSTGYYHAMALQQFLEQYAEAKKDPKNATWRLIFDIPKQNTSYVVTPIQYVWNQNVSKPTEILYNMQLKAWRRVDLQQKISPAVPSIQPISPGILQRIMSVIAEARLTCSAAIDLIGAVRSDLEAPLDILRQTTLFVKDLAGVVITVADLPFQLQRDYASAIKKSLYDLRFTIASTSSNPSVRKNLAAIVSSVQAVEGLTLAAVSGGQLGRQARIAQTIDPANNIFENPARFFTLMDQVPISSLTLTDAQQAQVDAVLQQARDTSVDDLRTYRSVIQDLSLQISNNFGAGSAYFAQIYGKPDPKVRVQPMTLDEYDILDSLYEALQTYDILTATTAVDDRNKETNMDYVAGLASDAGIDFTIPNSKIIVPVPFGLTIEGIALRYLGDASRWIEIATLNNLRDPYIDETGFTLPLLSNATGRQITISSSENLFIGQRIVIRSSTQPPSPRVILGIDRLSDTSYLITLDGNANLDNFLVADSAYLQAYLPGTINSQQKIFIPSEAEVSNGPNIVPPASTSSDPLTGLSKVDWLLTDTGDLAVNNFGDFRFAYGMTNIIQCLKIKLGTVKGTVPIHPEFGFGARPGVMNTEVNAQEIFNGISKLIEEDPRFQGLDSLQIHINGPVLAINMAVQVAGQSGVFPLSFQLSA